MKKILFAAAALSMVAVSNAAAQACAGTGAVTLANAADNTKQQAADVFQFVAPQLAQAVAGGSATLGQNSTMGGMGHFSVGVHGNMVAAAVPDVAAFQRCYGPRQAPTALPTSKAAIPMVGADAAIGVFGGLPLALTSVGAIDLLLSAQYVPEKTFSGVSVTAPDGALQVGYGARLGLLSESLVVPGVSLSYIKRDMPRLNVVANTGTDTLAITGIKVKSSSWRLAASKSLLLFNVGAGVGQDKFDSRVDTVRASVGAPVVGRTSGTILDQAQQLTRTNYFVNASFSLLVAKLTAEIGQSTGGTVTTYNTFSGSEPTGARTYGSLGVRFGL